MSLPKPMEEETFCPLLLDFSFIISSSLETSPGELIFFFFLFLWRGGSFLGKANMGKMTRSMAMEHKRNPLHLVGRDRWCISKDWKKTKQYSFTTNVQACLPVTNKARVTLVNVDDSFGVNIESDEDASQQVSGCRSQGSHHIHDGWKTHKRNYLETSTRSNTVLFSVNITQKLLGFQAWSCNQLVLKTGGQHFVWER